MKLKSFSFRNIGPYGNKIVDVDLMEEGGLWLVLGGNGQGKSTFLNMSKALYYGKVDKIKKDEIANRFNKHGWISGKVESSDGSQYNIERKFSPSGLTVEKDNVDLDIAGLSNAQNFIDNEVTMMPYQIYSNIISLSINDFKSFLSMSPKDKREIIDRIFSIEILNIMNKLVKNEMKNINFDIELMNREISTIQQTIQNYQLKLEEAALKSANDNTENINLINKSLEELGPKFTAIIEKQKDLAEKQNSYLTASNAISEQRNKILYDINSTKSKISLYEKDKCPTCNSSLNSQEHLVIKEHLYKELDALNDSLQEVTIKMQQLSEYGNKLNNAINLVQQANISCKTEWDNLNFKLSELTNRDTANEYNFQSLISNEIERVNDVDVKKQVKVEHLTYLTLLEKLYGGEGIKQQIIQSYLPVLNEEVAATLLELHFPYTIEFDSDFNSVISHLNLEISADTLSTGERKKVDLAVLLSIIKIMKRKYPHLNMFMLDEVLSSIDQDGREDIINILQSTSKELMINIFIVNHAPLPIEYFDRRITINKKDNFSEMVIDHLT